VEREFRTLQRDLFIGSHAVSLRREKSLADGTSARDIRQEEGGNAFSETVDFIETSSELFDHIKDRVPEQFKGGKSFDGNNLATREEILSHVRRKARRYDAITNRPLWPSPPDTFIRYTPNADRKPDGGALKDFVNRFHFASPIDRDLYIAAVITAFWGGPSGKRPFFVAAPPGFGGHEQAIGKTSAFESIGKLVGGYLDALALAVAAYRMVIDYDRGWMAPGAADIISRPPSDPDEPDAPPPSPPHAPAFDPKADAAAWLADDAQGAFAPASRTLRPCPVTGRD
jgi:hypothetical protein